jgi:putative transposase
MLTPAQVHYGQAAEVLAEQQRVLNAAYAAHPERFVKGPPKVPSLPQAVWINPPEDKTKSEIKLH